MIETGAHPAIDARHLLLGGRVQGVGFRPFVYRLAREHDIKGWVRNLTGQVEIFAQAPAAQLARFERALLRDAPPLARPEILSAESAAPDGYSGFSIRASERVEQPDIHVPPDYFACDDCVRELNDPADRRFRYPFINCTQCGPRYTLIARLPYDRPNTTMADFALCPACRREYENPLDRRFHAEPVGCPVCGPQLTYRDSAREVRDTQAALAACVAALREGKVVAVKGIGGYHLMCDARNEAAVMRLRERKPRPHKPLAVMAPLRGADGLDAVRDFATPAPEHAALLIDAMRPIVLVPKKDHCTLASTIAPGLNEVGVFLPYSPLHHLLLHDFGAPLVATSANISGEPVLTENEEVESRLAHVADACLHHDRAIARPADDPVYRVIAGAARPMRLGRGNAPLELALPFAVAHPVLAAGAHMKNTIALAWGRRAVISPHIGELDAPRSLVIFEQTIAGLQRLYQVKAERIVCDAHPGYASTRWAKISGLPVTAVFHHRAHASALAGEFPECKRWLVFTWDGTGYGEDGTLWGGEALLGSPGQWRRVASLRQFRLPGGEKAGREPWRSAAALCWELGIEWQRQGADVSLLHHAWRKGVNTPTTSAAGRLFDGAASLLGLIGTASFEGQGPMILEAAAIGDDAEAVAMPLLEDEGGMLRADWAPLVRAMLRDDLPVATRARQFHASLARAMVDIALRIKAGTDFDAVGLGGGVFQNKLLAELALEELARAGFSAHLPVRIPCNDAGIAFGQLVEACHGGASNNLSFPRKRE
jgi:hydrogenase maturation protein HypF